MSHPIREVTISRNPDGTYKQVRVVFGPHYFVDIFEEDGKVKFILGATHHGFMADASEVGGELEKIIDEIRRAHPDSDTG